MSDTMMQEILKRLDVLGEKIGTGAAFTWVALMRQAILVNGWGQTVLGLLLTLATLGFIKLAFWFCRQAPEDKDDNGQTHYLSGNGKEYAIGDEMGRGLGVAFSALAAGIALIAAVVIGWDGIQHIVNPQYYALMDLARMLGK